MAIILPQNFFLQPAIKIIRNAVKSNFLIIEPAVSILIPRATKSAISCRINNIISQKMERLRCCVSVELQGFMRFRYLGQCFARKSSYLTV
ncbi:hypothetical protein ASG14_00220 [Pedobacter sp. Leaf194]|nr:hypothetical protein ASG14_00220 [Pedobacter sp. Leaf194]